MHLRRFHSFSSFSSRHTTKTCVIVVKPVCVSTHSELLACYASISTKNSSTLASAIGLLLPSDFINICERGSFRSKQSIAPLRLFFLKKTTNLAILK